MVITGEQKRVLRDIFSWLAEPKKPYITLGGYAGTGKTTLLALFRQIYSKKKPKARVAFVAFTGKASQVLESRLKELDVKQPKDSVSTVHSLLYSPLMSSAGEILGWQQKKSLPFDLIVLDEASMVTEDLWRDILQFGVPVLAVGDHGQLPPIGDNFSLMKKPDLVLTYILRQAQESPIIKVATIARETGIIPIENFGQGVRKFEATSSDAQNLLDDFFQTYNEETLFLCGRNKTRVGINHSIRQALWRESQDPEAGDVVICLRNNWKAGLFNGLVGKLQSVKTGDQDDTLEAQILDLSGKHMYSGLIRRDTFDLTDKESLPHWKQPGEWFDFGYCSTVHKAQGSQAKKVIVIEERNQHMDDEMWRRWLYTAVTRATDELYIFGTV